MDPVAFSILGIDIKWYGILIAFGAFIGIFFALKEAKRVGFKEDDILDFLIIAIPVAIVGLRVYYVIFSLDYYMQHPELIFNIRNGGLAIHGGLIAAFVTAIVFCKKKNLNILQMADILFPGVAIGQSIGRWGNYINQEAYGGPTNLPWGIMIGGEKVHPTFLYESIATFCIFIFLTWYNRKKKKSHGETTAFYLILYSIARFFIEGLRTDSLMFFGMRVAQIVSLAAIVIGILLLMYVKKSRKTHN